MKKNYFVGIGGTGARALESLVYLCAAGLGPEKIKAILVDPDKGNGNLERTKRLIDAYAKVRRKLQLSADYALSTERQTKELSAVQFFKTEIELCGEWGILDDTQTGSQANTLETHINLATQDQATKDLVDLLFSKTELETKLDEGFRGHPSIGAVVLSGGDLRKAGPWKEFFKDITEVDGENSIGMFLCGSVFGGTGAAGVPTFGKKEVLKAHSLIEGDKHRLVMGAALVLPYFQVHANEGAAVKEKLFVDSQDFAIATKAALSFYESQDLAFDRVYLLGDSVESRQYDFATGQKAQKNDPHYIELITALAACDFWSEKHEEGKKIEKKYAYASRPGVGVSWNDLPLTLDAGSLADKKQKVFYGLMEMVTFSATMVTYGRSVFDGKQSKDNWLRRPKYGTLGENQVQDLAVFCTGFLAWMAMLHRNSQNLGLVKMQALLQNSEEAIRILDTCSTLGKLGEELKGAMVVRPDIFAPAGLDKLRPDHGTVSIRPDSQLDWDQFQNVTLTEVDTSKIVSTWSESEKLIRHFELAVRVFCQAYVLN